MSVGESLSSTTNNKEGQDVNSQLLLEGGCSSESSRAKPTRKRCVWSSCESFMLDSWVLEIVSMIFSTACFIAIAAVLIAFNGKKRPNISYDLSLNTIISMLATACKSSLVFAVGEAISQLKWAWFQDRRELVAMQTFEDSSRGPLGSITLLGHHKGRSVVSLGAIIMVLMLVFDPFIQQILSYPTGSTTEQPRTTNTTGFENLALAPQIKYFDSTNVSETDWNGASYLGVWSSDFGIQPQCPLGNCTWPIYKSLAMCSKCADVTSVATLNCPTPEWNSTGNASDSYSGKCEVVLPQGHSSATSVTLNVVNGTISTTDLQTAMVWEVSNEVDQYDNKTYLNISRPQMVLAEASLGLDDDKISNQDMVPGIYIEHVTECAISYCIQEFDISVHNGYTTLQKVSRDFGQLLSLNNSLTGINTLCWAPSGTPSDVGIYTSTVGNESIGMNTSDFVFCDFKGLSSDAFTGTKLDRYFIDDGDALLKTSARATPANVAHVMRMGLNLTMEQTAAAWTQMGLQNTNITIVGTIYNTEVMVKVQWLWLILPASLVLGSNVFLTLTILKSKKGVLWKSSVLALLFHGMKHVDRDEHSTSSGMQTAAENLYVKLQYCNSDGRVMLDGAVIHLHQ